MKEKLKSLVQIFQDRLRKVDDENFTLKKDNEYYEKDIEKYILQINDLAEAIQSLSSKLDKKEKTND